jgi:immunity protein 27 of polymorphic toxin system
MQAVLQVSDNVTAPKQLRGSEAVRYAEADLRTIRVNTETWEVEFIDPNTVRIWIMDYAESGQHGGGSPRLRRQGDTM